MGIEERIDALEDKIDKRDEEIIVLKNLLRKVIDGEKIKIERYTEKCGIWNNDIEDYCDGKIIVTVLDTEHHICPKCGKDVDNEFYIRR